jgi:hypothetical protein
VFLVIIGFGSALLHSTGDIQFTLLVWADGMQPYIGLVVGLIGVALLASPFILRARQARTNGQQAMPQGAFGQQPGFEQPQGFGPPAGFPVQTGFAQPQPFEQQGGFAQPGFAQPGFPPPNPADFQQPPFGQGPQQPLG